MWKEGQCGWEKNAREIQEKQKRHPYLRRVTMYGTNVWCSSADGCLEEIIGFLRWHRTAFTWMRARLCKACFEYRSRVNGQTSTVSNYPLFFDEPSYSISCPCFNTSRKYLLVLIRTFLPMNSPGYPLLRNFFPRFIAILTNVRITDLVEKPILDTILRMRMCTFTYSTAINIILELTEIHLVPPPCCGTLRNWLNR